MSSIGGIFGSSELRSANDPYFEKLSQMEQVIVTVVNFVSNDLIVEVISLPDPLISRTNVEQERMETELDQRPHKEQWFFIIPDVLSLLKSSNKESSQEIY